MKKILLAVCAFLIIIHAYADNPKIDLEAFAQKHFEKMIATQAPDATKEDLESYLGAHTEYSAELLEVFIFNDSAIALRYKDHAKGIHPQNKQKNRI